MMVHIVLWIECREWQPRKRGRKSAALYAFPEHARPFDVVVTVIIATADGIGGELELPEDEADDDGAR
jgi:hypothetical protein